MNSSKQIVLGSEQNLSNVNFLTYNPNPRLGRSKEKSYKSSDGKKRYFLGIIDTLTFYNWRKKFEYGFKYNFVSKKISCIPPMDYHFRFYQFISDAIVIDDSQPLLRESVVQDPSEKILQNQLSFKDPSERNLN